MGEVAVEPEECQVKVSANVGRGVGIVQYLQHQLQTDLRLFELLLIRCKRTLFHSAGSEQSFEADDLAANLGQSRCLGLHALISRNSASSNGRPA